MLIFLSKLTNITLVINKPVKLKRANLGIRLIFNSSENDWNLLTGWILGTFMVEGDYPILAIRGDQASGKSCMTDFNRSIVDRNSNPVKTLPKDSRTLMITAMNSLLLGEAKRNLITTRVS